MGYATRVEVGKPLRLNLQLSNGEVELPKKVLAYLRDHDGNMLISGIALNHVGQGLFKNHQNLMPDNTAEITAQYIVFNMDDTLDDNYIIDFDLFEPERDNGGSSSTTTLDDGVEVFFSDEENNFDIVYEDNEQEKEVIVIDAILSDVEEIDVIIEDDEI